MRGNHTLMFLSLSPSLHLSKKKKKSFKKIKKIERQMLINHLVIIKIKNVLKSSGLIFKMFYLQFGLVT